MLDFRVEQMGPHFTKHHIGGLPFAAVIHHFTAPDHGAPHDHPFLFRSTILSGGYVEETFTPRGPAGTVNRRPGDSYNIPAAHLHRIIELPAGECWTLIQPLGPKEREPGFYQFAEDGLLHRFWYEDEWRNLEAKIEGRR